MTELSAEQIAYLKSRGYSEEEIARAKNEMDKEMPQQPSPSRASNSMFSGAYQDNLVKWQLELDSILERVEHMLKRDRVAHDEKGNLTWQEGQENDRIFNNFGVHEILRILAMYINRNTILSNYTDEAINEKCLDLGQTLNDLIFMKYEEMGLNTYEKRKIYPIIIRQIVDIVHSAYLRALNGGERESLRVARTISQTEQLSPNYGYPQAGGQTRGLLNPARYIIGKYK